MEQPFATRRGALGRQRVEALFYPVHRNGRTAVVNVLLRAVDPDGRFMLDESLNDGNTELNDNRSTSPDGLRLVDGEHGRAYLPAMTSQGTCLCSPVPPPLSVRLETQWWVSVTFAAPPVTVRTVSVEVPQFGSVTDVPVV